jgi:hypothetical protein
MRDIFEVGDNEKKAIGCCCKLASSSNYSYFTQSDVLNIFIFSWGGNVLFAIIMTTFYGAAFDSISSYR